MASIQENKIVCNSCGSHNHKRATSKRCPNSRFRQEIAAERIENTLILKEKLKIFEDFILENNITMDDLAPVYCPKWMERNHFMSNKWAWKLDSDLKEKLVKLYQDVAENTYACDIEGKDILNVVSERVKIICGIVGATSVDTGIGPDYHTRYDGARRLMRIWGVALESKNEICRYCVGKQQIGE